jgi:hypothetical protein
LAWLASSVASLTKLPLSSSTSQHRLSALLELFADGEDDVGQGGSEVVMVLKLHSKKGVAKSAYWPWQWRPGRIDGGNKCSANRFELQTL